MIGISDLEYLCAEVRQIARKAGAFLRDERQKFDRERVEEKSAHNYVSYVDKESERRLVEQLSTLLPEAGFIAEEGSGSLTDEEYCWVIDPLDGTSNYIHDMAPYSVSIALRDREELLLGVVYEVCRNECFYAWKGSKAYLDGKEIRVTDVAVLDKAFVALGMIPTTIVRSPKSWWTVCMVMPGGRGCWDLLRPSSVTSPVGDSMLG